MREPLKQSRSQEWSKFPTAYPTTPRITAFKTDPNRKDLTLDIQLNPGDRVIINTEFGSIVLSHQTRRIRMAMQGRIAARGDEPYGLLSSPEDSFRPQNEMVIDLERNSEDLRTVKEAEFRRHRHG